jgi:hypothetical protein
MISGEGGAIPVSESDKEQRQRGREDMGVFRMVRVAWKEKGNVRAVNIFLNLVMAVGVGLHGLRRGGRGPTLG